MLKWRISTTIGLPYVGFPVLIVRMFLVILYLGCLYFVDYQVIRGIYSTRITMIYLCLKMLKNIRSVLKLLFPVMLFQTKWRWKCIVPILFSSACDNVLMPKFKALYYGGIKLKASSMAIEYYLRCLNWTLNKFPTLHLVWLTTLKSLCSETDQRDHPRGGNNILTRRINISHTQSFCVFSAMEV